MDWTIVDLTVELETEPLGLDVLRPRFGWRMENERRGARQTAYRIQVMDEQDKRVWDSGLVEDSASQWIAYDGEALRGRTRYRWTVEVTADDGSVRSAESWWETGLMDEGDEEWHGAKWIGVPELSLVATAQSIFALEAKFRLGEDGWRFGLIFGANDPRLMDANKNDHRLSGENYIEYAVTADGCLTIARVGYAPEDRPDAPLRTERMVDVDTGKAIAFDPKAEHVLRVEVYGNNACAFLDDIRVDAVEQRTPDYLRQRGAPETQIMPRQLNPYGGNDVTTYPLLCDIGVSSEGEAELLSLRVRNLRPPKAQLFSLEAQGLEDRVTHEAGQWAEREDGSLTLHDARLLLDPSHGGTPLLRRNFMLTERVVKARLYATARGVYECWINGKRVGDRLFPPGASQYDRHMAYQTYDVTEHVRLSGNAFGVSLASGWWNEGQTYSLMNHNYWGDRPAFRALLEIELWNGEVLRFPTNPDQWRYRTDGPVRYAGWFYGEHYDARQQGIWEESSSQWGGLAGWRVTKEIPAVDFSELEKQDGPMGWPVPSMKQPALVGEVAGAVHHVATLMAQRRLEPKPGVYIYDMGQNMVGVPRVTMRGKPGIQAALRYAEELYPPLAEYGELAGTLLTANYRDALSIDRYTFATDQPETYQPKFTFHGYRYIEITGVETPPEPADVLGCVYSSIQAWSADFTCSDPLVNRLYENIRWSQASNFLSIPTDCPQRNERMGWSGDIQVFARTAVYNANVYGFLRRWLQCIRDCQLPDGRFPDIAPVGGGFGGILWGSAGVVVPYELWKQYGDLDVLRENYPAMKRYLEYIGGQGELGRLDNVGPLGDWLASDLSTDPPLLWNAMHYRMACLMVEMAEAIGEVGDTLWLADTAERIRRVWNRTFVDPETGRTRSLSGEINDTQCSYAVPLAFELFDDAVKAGEHLARKTEEVGHTVTTGFVGTGALCPALCEAGYTEDAYRLLTQREYPSWLYSVTQGATTIWERWNSVTREEGFGGNNSMNSFNHYSLGAVGAWLLGDVLGIRRGKEKDGFRTFRLRPYITGLEEARGCYDSLYGRIESHWKRGEDGIDWTVTIPANTSAEVWLPVDGTLEGGKPFVESDGVRAYWCAEGLRRYVLSGGKYVLTLK